MENVRKAIPVGKNGVPLATREDERSHLLVSVEQGAGTERSRGKDVVRYRTTNSTCCTVVSLVAILVAFMCGYYVREHQTAADKKRISQLENLIINEVVHAEHELIDRVQANPLVHELEERLAEVPDDAHMCPDGLMVDGPMPTLGNSILFLLVLAWTFLGVAVFADLFMVAIEEITSAETVTKVQVGNGKSQTITTKVWNPTVSNLTLMALGSSAPEILLSVVEIFGNNFYSGELGPSTIVGSAAFNLFVISAVCVYAIPEGEGRLIQERGVFYITATFSVLAYAWLVVILNVNTPNMVDVWEGAATFIAFPILVGLAYQADVGVNPCAICCVESIEPLEDGSPKGKSKRRVRVEESDFDKKSGAERANKMSKAYYRINATRKLTGSRSIENAAEDQAQLATVSVAEDQSSDINFVSSTVAFTGDDSQAKVRSLSLLRLALS